MVFHVACPITCRRICFCPLGFPRPLHAEASKNEFLREVHQVEEFLKDPWGIRARNTNGTVQVAVPKIVAPPPPVNGDVAEDEEASAQTKRVALQKKAAAMVVAAEDYARRFESGDLAGDASKSNAGEEQGQSGANVLCRMCFFGETEGSERARKMLSCKSCGKKYHRSCLKNWAQHRDLFHWSSWTCPSCRICEVCRRTGDPNKFVFCRRCDAAYHCYCQHPPHKNISSGPYLCPKHTRCHSCGSNVPGNGLSVRWFLGYTCCDACGRLFVKGNYCPVCLKVYRDSESTPMVCCDICQRWVHCRCDGISDEKYQQFQEDGNLQYKCATCRGECYQVKDIDDAIQELWRRRDEADRDLIASLRAAAGLPTQEEIFSISPYSDDEDPVISKNEFGRSIKFSLKGLINKSPKKSSNKKYSKRKGSHPSSIGKAEQTESFGDHQDAQSLQDSLGDNRNDDVQSHRNEGINVISSPVPGSASYNEGTRSVNQSGVLKHKLIHEVMVNNEDRRPTLRIKSKKPHVKDHGSKTNTLPMKKLVISLGSKKINMTSPPNSDATSHQRELESAALNGTGSEDASGQRSSNNVPTRRLDGAAKASEGYGFGHSGQIKSLKFTGRERNLIKLGKAKSEISDKNPKGGEENVADGHETAIQEQPYDIPERSIGATVGPGEIPASRGEKVYFRKKFERKSDLHGERNEDYSSSPASNSLPKDSKPLLKLRFKKPQCDNQDSQGSHGEEVKNIHKGQEEEKSSIKGQRSKRKRPAVFVDKLLFNESEENKQSRHDNLMDEIMDANWILKKLGKDGIGKRVEVQQSSDNSWHKGVVTDTVEGTSTLYVTLDDGRVRTLELGKHGVRFVSQKQKRSKMG